MAYFIASLISLISLSAFMFFSSVGMVNRARLASFIAACALAYEHTLLAFVSFWQYLINNSFCPWIMIFRGRPSTQICTEAASHARSCLSSNNFLELLDGVMGFGISIIELIGGPALGIALTAAWVFIGFKASALIFSKLFNRKL